MAHQVIKKGKWLEDQAVLSLFFGEKDSKNVEFVDGVLTNPQLNEHQLTAVHLYINLYIELLAAYGKFAAFDVLDNAMKKQKDPQKPLQPLELRYFFLHRPSGKNLLTEIFKELDLQINSPYGIDGFVYRAVMGGIKVVDSMPKPEDFVSFKDTILKMIHEILSLYQKLKTAVLPHIAEDLFKQTLSHFDKPVCDFTQDDLTLFKEELNTVVMDDLLVRVNRQNWKNSFIRIGMNLSTLRRYIRNGMESYPCSHIKLTSLVDLMSLLRVHPNGDFARDFSQTHSSREQFFWRLYIDFLFRTLGDPLMFGIPNIEELKTYYASEEKCEVFSKDIAGKLQSLEMYMVHIQMFLDKVKILDFIKEKFCTFLASQSLCDVNVASYSEMIFSALEKYFGKDLSELKIDEYVYLYDILMNANCIAQNDFSIMRELAITQQI